MGEKKSHCPRDQVDEEMIELVSPALGIAGWSDPNLNILDYGQIEAEKSRREVSEAMAASGCYAFGGPHSASSVVGDMDPKDAATAHNLQIAKIIDLLGKTGAGRRAILKAVAEKQGVTDEMELERLYEGKSDVKLRVPVGLRETMTNVGLGDSLAPLHILTAVEPSQILVNDDAWHDLEFEVALDSGSVVHVCSLEDCPGYRLGESPGSRRGQEFLMGDGGTIPNLGQSQVNLSDDGRDIQSVFQIAAVTRPLMSVGRICDEGHSITFNAVMAVVHSKDGDELCRFHRKDGGLYVATLKSRRPAGFGRQE